MQRGRRRRAFLAAVFLLLAKHGPHSHTYLAISHKVLHFFPTPSALPCARITVSVELNFFSLFSSLSCTHNPFCIETVRVRRFLPPFSPAPTVKSPKENSSVSPAAVFLLHTKKRPRRTVVSCHIKCVPLIVRSESHNAAAWRPLRCALLCFVDAGCCLRSPR